MERIVPYCTLLQYVAQTQPPTAPFTSLELPLCAFTTSTTTSHSSCPPPPAQLLQCTIPLVSPPPAKQARYDHRPCHICGATPADLRTHVEDVHLPWNNRPEVAGCAKNHWANAYSRTWVGTSHRRGAKRSLSYMLVPGPTQ